MLRFSPRLHTRCAALAAATALLALPAAASADSRMESMFQDDDELINTSAAGAQRTMSTLKQLGVDRVRITVKWSSIAPGANSPNRPSFDAADPNAYAAAAWAPYDRIVRLGRRRGIAVNFNVTAPAPNWATGTPPPKRPELDSVFAPDPRQFGLFVQALGTRYSGTFKAGTSVLPRVSYWTIWNEPNQGAWLAPQYTADPSRKGKFVETSPVLYRSLVDTAWAALNLTGHGPDKDTILIGETAPKGSAFKPDVGTAMTPLRFLRTLYCVDDNLQRYTGTAATLRGCPTGKEALAAFVEQHPALFGATGYAHHPYELVLDPRLRPKDKDSVTIANLDALQGILRRIYQRYQQPLLGGGRGVPLYLTEFGFQSNPPDGTGSTLVNQAKRLNESEYRVFNNKYVRTLSQFLLVDSKPVKGDYGPTFQTGLTFDLQRNHRKKPAFSAYAMGIVLPKERVGPSRKLKLWGVARVAPQSRVQTVRVEFRRKGAKRYARIGSLKTNGKTPYVAGTVKVRRSGTVRLVWRALNGRTWHSRAAAFTITG